MFCVTLHLTRTFDNFLANLSTVKARKIRHLYQYLKFDWLIKTTNLTKRKMEKKKKEDKMMTMMARRRKMRIILMTVI